MKTLAQIQKELKAPKSQVNTFGKYNYRNCEDILEALKPLMHEDDVFSITDDLVLIGERYYIKATATFNDKTASAFAREALTKKGMDESQITGSTSSYARKYALNGLFAIDDTKDADHDDKSKDKTDGIDGVKPKDKTSAELKKLWSQIKDDIEKAQTVKELNDCLRSYKDSLDVIKAWDTQCYNLLEDAGKAMRELLNNPSQH